MTWDIKVKSDNILLPFSLLQSTFFWIPISAVPKKNTVSANIKHNRYFH